VIEPVEAATVKMIFSWRGVDHLTVTEIQRRLTESRYPAPLDPQTEQPVGWTRAIVHAILTNPKYVDRQVWGRHRHGRRVHSTRWIWSPAWAHPPIVTLQEFAAANQPHRLARPSSRKHGGDVR
jgi:hypothetical protein